MFKKPPSSPSQRKGLHYEHLALRFLQDRGLVLLARNYHCRCGEIDLILRDGDTVVFAEVRYRENDGHGTAVESIGYRKRVKIVRTACHYLLVSGLQESCPSRFDVLGISMHRGEPVVQWIRNAFY